MGLSGGYLDVSSISAESVNLLKSDSNFRRYIRALDSGYFLFCVKLILPFDVMLQFIIFGFAAISILIESYIASMIFADFSLRSIIRSCLNDALLHTN